MPDPTQVDAAIKLVNEYLKEYLKEHPEKHGNIHLINKSKQNSGTIVEITKTADRLSEELLEGYNPDKLKKYEKIVEACTIIYENSLIFSRTSSPSANMTLRELAEHSTPKPAHDTSPAHPTKPPQSPRRH